MLKQHGNGWTVHDALAVARLRQWAIARARLRNGSSPVVSELRGRPGKSPKTNRYDAALVFVLDFEAALEALPASEKALLVLRFRDGLSQGATAEAIGMSARTVYTWEQQAIERLAIELDKRNML